MELTILIFLLLAERLWLETRVRKERMHYLNFIDRLQNKLMARDLGEYQSLDRPIGGVKNPLMERIAKNKERSQ